VNDIALLPILTQQDLFLNVCKGNIEVKSELFLFLLCAFDFKVYLMPEEYFFLVFDPI